MTPPAAEILTIKDVAGYLKTSERTIYRLVAAGSIPSFKLGGAWRFPRAAIDRWIEQQTRQPSQHDKAISQARSRRPA